MTAACAVLDVLLIILTWFTAAESGYLKRTDDLTEMQTPSYWTVFYMRVSAASALSALFLTVVIACR